MGKDGLGLNGSLFDSAHVLKTPCLEDSLLPLRYQCEERASEDILGLGLLC